MDNAALLEEYKDATISLLINERSGDPALDLKMRIRRYEAWVELAKRNLLGTQKYIEAVMAADRIANESLALIRNGTSQAK
jgi:hypothetical protein